jgi:hypothetical protein
MSTIKLTDAERAFQSGELLKKLSILGNVRYYMGEASIGKRTFDMLIRRNKEKAEVNHYGGTCVRYTTVRIK